MRFKACAREMPEFSGKNQGRRPRGGAKSEGRAARATRPRIRSADVGSERAATLPAQLDLELGGGGEGRLRLADDLVGRRAPLERLVAQVLVPDLADAGVVPADHVIADRSRGRHGKDGGGDAGDGTKGENATHEKSPDGEV